MTVRFTVEPSGRVGSSSIAGSTLGDAATDACIVAAVEPSSRRPTAAAPSPITYPLRFRP